MFSLSHQEPLSTETRSASPATRAHLWAVRSATFALAIGVAAGSVLVGSHVAFAQTGAPHCAGMPDWPAYSAREDGSMQLGEAVAFKPVPMRPYWIHSRAISWRRRRRWVTR